MWTERRYLEDRQMKGTWRESRDRREDSRDKSVIENDNDKIWRQQDKETARFGAPRIFAFRFPVFPLAPSPSFPHPPLWASLLLRRNRTKQLINSDLLCFPVYSQTAAARKEKGKGRNRKGGGSPHNGDRWFHCLEMECVG